MFQPKEVVEMLKKEYPKGTRIELVQMEDMQAPPVGTKGTVQGIDGAGDILMSWDTGSSLKLIYGKDVFKKVLQ